MFKLFALSSILGLSSASSTLRGLGVNTCAVPSNRKDSPYLGNKLILTKPSKVEATFCSPNSNFRTNVYAYGPNVSGPEQVLIGNTKTTTAPK